MASNEVEVLDPAPTVEKLKKFASERVLNRRHFIAALGVAGAAAVGTELVRSGPTALAQQPKPNGYAQSDVLNFLLNVKYLKATLYSYATQGADLPASSFGNLGTGGVFNAPGKITFASAGPATAQQITDLFNEMYYDELNQLIALRNLLGSAVYARQTMNLLGTGTTTTATATWTQPQFIGYARMLEDLSASAFAGATIYLTGTNLEYVTQALAVNGFHAGAVRLLAIQTGAYYYSGQEITTGSAGAGSLDAFTGVTTSGSPIVYYTTPTNAIVTGTDVSGPGIPEGTVITAVNPPTVITGSIAAGSNQITQVTITPSNSTIVPAVGEIVSGSGIPTNTIITAVNGSNSAGYTLTVGTVTGYSDALYTPIIDGLTGVTGSGGVGMAASIGQNFPLAFTGGGGTGAAGTLTVLSDTSFSVNMTSYGSGYTSAPTVTATGLTVATGGSLPSLTASVGSHITTTASNVVLTLGFLAVTNKTTSLTGVSSFANLANGEFLTGTNVPTLATITALSPSTATVTTSASTSAATTLAPTGTVISGSPVITSVSSTSGLAVGQPISGTGIPSGATIKGIGFDPAGPNITLSANATATSSSTSTVSPTCLLTKGSNLVNALSSLSGLAVGNTVTGTGIPSGTTITAVGTINTMTLSNNATTTTPTPTTTSIQAQLGAGGSVVTFVAANPYTTSVFPTTLKTGQLVTDTQGNLAPFTTISSITTSSNTITLSAPAIGSSTLTNVATFTGTVVADYQTLSSIPASAFTAGIAPGMAILGTNIPSGTIITAVSASAGTISISQFPTSAAGAEVTANSSPPASFTVQSGTILNLTTLQNITVTTKTSTESLTVNNFETVSLNLLGNVVLSQAATATAATGTSLTFISTDPMDVEPADPGTASAAAAGPSAIPGTSPPAYQGFFDTAGAATSSANNPAGSVFARTFSQVLAVLYGSTTAQTYQGGFFPVGVSGNINFV